MISIKEGNRVLREVPLHEMSSLCLYGNIQVTTQALQTLCASGVPVALFSMGGWFYGIARGLEHKNVELRRLQYRAADAPAKCLKIARTLISDKIRNCRTLLRRLGSGIGREPLASLKELARKARAAPSAESLLGIEGTAARLYFQHFSSMIKAGSDGMPPFSMDGRNRRPPADPVNAMLSYLYAVLAKTWSVTCQLVGFDPFLGFYHKVRYGRPSLALDMMEPFRPLVADSAVLTAVNTGVVRPEDFITRLGSVTMNKEARGGLIEAYERRLSQEITHPVFGYKVTYRQVFEVQARLLARYLAGEIPQPPAFITR